MECATNTCRQLLAPDAVWLVVEIVVMLVIIGFLLRLILGAGGILLGPVFALLLFPFRFVGRLGAVIVVCLLALMFVVLPGPLSPSVGALARQDPDGLATVRVQVQWTDTEERNRSLDVKPDPDSCDNVVTTKEVLVALEAVTSATPKTFQRLKSFGQAKKSMRKALLGMPAHGGFGEQGKNVLRKKWGKEIPKIVRPGTGRIDVENIRGDRNLTR